MCEAYDAEYRSIVQSEGRYAIHGFVAALTGQPRACPGPAFKGEAEAWYHGYNCATCSTPIIPWSAVRCLTGDNTLRRIALEEQFKVTRTLTAKEIATLKSEGWILAHKGVPPVPDRRLAEISPARPISFED